MRTFGSDLKLDVSSFPAGKKLRKDQKKKTRGLSLKGNEHKWPFLFNNWSSYFNRNRPISTERNGGLDKFKIYK